MLKIIVNIKNMGKTIMSEKVSVRKKRTIPLSMFEIIFFIVVFFYEIDAVKK